MNTTPLSVMIVDDSALMRNLISKIIENSPGLTVLATAMNGQFALQKLQSIKPDVIILDLEMPQMNGIEFLKKRKELKITIPVIILSSIARRGAEITMEALSLGASDFIKKPSGSISEDIHVIGKHLVELVHVYGAKSRGVTLTTPSIEEITSSTTVKNVPADELILPKEKLRSHSRLSILALGISTGGPNALRQVFAGLDADFPLPILVVQHMPSGFTAEFARSLDKICSLEVKEAEEGDLIKKGRVILAPGDYHIEVEKRSLAGIVHVTQSELINGHRPSAGVLFRSVAKYYGASAFAVIMTGMGRDGSAEIGEIYQAGGLTIAQDETSCIVFGMPKVAISLGHIEKVVSLNDMASTLNQLAKQFAS